MSNTPGSGWAGLCLPSNVSKSLSIVSMILFANLVGCTQKLPALSTSIVSKLWLNQPEGNLTPFLFFKDIVTWWSKPWRYVSQKFFAAWLLLSSENIFLSSTQRE